MGLFINGTTSRNRINNIMSINKQKGICGYCLGQGELVVPFNNDPKEAEKNNFYTKICPVCYGTKESQSEDTFKEDEDFSDELTEDMVLGLDDFSEFISEEEDEEDNESNDINNQS